VLPFLGRVRRHHAVEHATVAILLSRRARPTPVLGLSDFSGFHLHGDFTAEEVEWAAQEALRRLAAGESGLAISNQCGTNLVVTGLFTAFAALAAAGRKRREGFQAAVTAATFASVAAVPAGRWVQRNFTTSCDTSALRLERVRQMRFGRRPHFKVYLASR
jgi:hypothetical protein